MRVTLPEARLSLEMPKGLQPVHGPAVGRTRRVYAYGQLGIDPVRVELVVDFVGGYVTEQSLPAAMDLLHAGFEQEPPHDRKRGPLHRVTAGDRPALRFGEQDEKGVGRDTWATIMGDRHVLLMVYSYEKTPPYWACLGDVLFRSLRDETP
jgi:hypothetical protein